jgi:hypothetical protein
MTTVASPGRPLDIKNDHLADYAYAGDSLAEGALEKISKLQVRKGETLPFIHELLVRFLCEDSPLNEPVGDDANNPNDIENSIRFRVDSLIILFCCSDEYMSKSQQTQAVIEKQIKLWNYLVRKTPGRPDRRQNHVDYFHSSFRGHLRTKFLSPEENHETFSRDQQW